MEQNKYLSNSSNCKDDFFEDINKYDCKKEQFIPYCCNYSVGVVGPTGATGAIGPKGSNRYY